MHRITRHLIPLTFLLALLVAPGPPAGAQTSPDVSDELLIRYRPALRAAERAAVRAAAGAQHLHGYGLVELDHVRVDGDVEQAIQAIQSDPRVLYVERNVLWSLAELPNDPLLDRQWGLRNTGQTGGLAGADIEAQGGWDVFTGDPDLLIGVVDTGIDLGHEDLYENLWTNPGEVPNNGVDDDGNGWVDDVHGYDFVNRDGDPFDDHGHGTHVAGIIAARTHNETGTAGVVWRAKLVALKFLNSQGVGPTSDAILAIEYAVANGIRITNNSWGGTVYSQALFDALVAANHAGHLAIAAAGNRADDIDEVPFYPAAYDVPNVFSVAATTDCDELAGFSSYGLESVDIGAPGEFILSTTRGDTYGLLSGTSMAAPHVAGAAALLLGRVPDLTPAQVAALMMDRSDPIPALQGRVASGGRLNLLRTLSNPDSTPPGPVAGLVLQNIGSNSARISWIASGDDGAVGIPFAYEVRFATFPIDSTNVHLTGRFELRAKHAPGERETLSVTGLEVLTPYYFAVRAADEFNNLGGLSPWVRASTLGPPRAEATPERFEVDLFAGENTTRVLTLWNTRQGTLDFTLDAPAFRFPGAYVPTVGRNAVAPAGAGGPDPAGYRWIDSREPDGPEFAWVDPALGTVLELQGDDATSAPVSLGFRFPFYGVSFDSVRICTNGWMSFSSHRVHHLNLPLPTPDAPPDLVAPFWDDLSFGIECHVTTWTDGSRFVATWNGVGAHSGGGPYRFQAILYATGEIRFQYLSMPPPVTSATVGLQDTDGTRGLLVVHNDALIEDSLAVRIVPLPDWAKTDVRAGRVIAGDSLQIAVNFDATGLLAGRYAGVLVVRSNDPDRPSISVPMDLMVRGAPDVRAEPAALALGRVFVGTEKRGVLRVRNVGTDSLHVSQMASDHADVAVAAGGFDLAANTFRDIEVRYAPQSDAPLTAGITVHSDDADTPQWIVPVLATPLEPPVFDVPTTPLHAELSFKTDTVQTVRVWNRGGTPLEVDVRASVAGAGVSGAGARWAGAFAPGAKGARDDGFFVGALPQGGPDAFGYGWRDSDVPGGPEFEWMDVRAGGTLLPIVGDDVTSAAVELGFAFPFYGQSFDHVRICTNGWLSFTSSLNAFANTPLPIAIEGVPENLLAVFWDDLHFGAVRRVWVWSDGTRFVAQFQEVGRFGEGVVPNTFQVVLSADGRIRYQYLTLKAETLNSATVGLQNASRDDGLLVVFNSPYLRDSLAIEFTPPAGWLRVAPEQASIAAGEGLDFNVTFDAAGRLGGAYTGRLELATNDPFRRNETIACALDVSGVPQAIVRPVTLDFGVVYPGHARTLALEVDNPGTDTLRVFDVTFSDPVLTTGVTAFVVAPLGQTQLPVTLTAAAHGALAGQITLTTNAPGAASVRIPVVADVQPPPIANVSSPDLDAVLAATLGPRAANGAHPVVLHNAGESTLAYAAAAHAPVATRGAPHAPAIERAKGLAIPAGSLGDGGPDAAGYRWTDSDAPGGRPFQWQEVRASGERVDLDADDQTSEPIALPFSFPFYDMDFDSVRISTNGFVSFTHAGAPYTNAGLPNAGPAAPENLIAVMWDDLDFRPSAGEASAYVFAEADRFIVSWYDAPRFASPSTSTFQLILHRDGSMDLQYLTLGDRSNEATVGIQNATRNVGLQVVHAADYLKEGLRVHIERLPAWLSVTPRSGTVAPGESDTLTVRFDARGREDGPYQGSVTVRTNDPEHAERILAARLQIAAAHTPLRVDLDASHAPPKRRVEIAIDTPAGFQARELIAADTYLGDVRASSAEAVGGSVVFGFDRRKLAAAITSGASRLLDFAGFAPGPGWFGAPVTLRWLPPRPGALRDMEVTMGDPVLLEWSDDPGLDFDVWMSADDGASWSRLVTRLADNRLEWTSEGEPGQRLFEVAAYDTSGYRGSAYLGPVNVEAVPAPSRFDLAIAGANPTADHVLLQLAIPVRTVATLRVYDVRGRLLRSLHDGPLHPGRHAFVWDGTDATGRRVEPGVYFLHARSPAADRARRIVVIR